MSQIEIRCVDQTAMFTNLPEIFSGDVNIDTVKFTFDDSWNGYTTKTAVFYNNPKDVYPQILDVNDVAVIPSQVMTKECKLSIGVFGTKANGDVKTSKILTYNVGKGALNSDLESTPATPDFWTQLLARQINFENNINSTVDTFQTTVNSKVDGLETNVETVEAIAKGRNQALAYNSYSEMITALNGMTKDELKRGQNIYIGTVGVPDLWVYSVETTKSTYSYTNDVTFVNSLNNNVTVKVGYYKLAQLETQKVDVGGINASIEGLQSDIETLNNDFDTLLAKPDNTLIWNISDEIYVEKTDLGITIGTEVTNYGSIADILYFNNKVYVLTYNSTKYLYIHVYDGTNWIHKQIRSDSTSYERLIEFKGDIYVKFLILGTNYVGFGKWSNETSTFSIIKSKYYDDGTVSCCLTKDENYLYFVHMSKTSSTYNYVTANRYDGTTVTEDSIDYDIYSKIQTAYTKDDKLYIVYYSSNNTSTKIFKLDDSFTNLYGFNNLFSSISDAVRVKNSIYAKIDNVIAKVNQNICEYIMYGSFLNSYDDSMTIYDTSLKQIKQIKPYRVATSYATKGTKILLGGNHKPLTDNLQTVEGGYEVTSNGEVKITLYE